MQHCDGFAHYGTSANLVNIYGTNNTFPGAATIDAAIAPTIGVFIRPNSGFYVWRVLDGVQSKATFGARTFIPQLPAIDNSMQIACFWRESGALFYYVVVDISGRLVLRNSANAVVAQSPTNTFTFGVDQYIEMQVDIPSQTIEVRLDGVVHIILAGVAMSGATSILRVGSGMVGSNRFHYQTDWYINDGTGAITNTFLGPLRCRTLFVDANGPTQNWTPNAVPAWDKLIDVPPAIASYIEATTVGQISSFTFGNIPLNTSAVYALAVFSFANKSDADVASYQVSISNSNGTITGTPKSPTIAAGYFRDFFELDGGGFYWDILGVNNATFSIERTV